LRGRLCDWVSVVASSAALLNLATGLELAEAFAQLATGDGERHRLDRTRPVKPSRLVIDDLVVNREEFPVQWYGRGSQVLLLPGVDQRNTVPVPTLQAPASQLASLTPSSR
jgi:hypothetical protein